MREIILDGKKMPTIEIAYSYIKKELNFPDYFGFNLDALWDLLSTLSEPVHIKLIHTNELLDSLNGYGATLLNIFVKAGQFNHKLNFEYE